MKMDRNKNNVKSEENMISEKNRKSDVSYVISLKKAYSWTKRIFIALLIIWIVAAILFFGGYYFR